MPLSRETLAAGEASSLRANGSRECAPDDKLREAIQKAKNWIASSQELLAMTKVSGDVCNN
jgi:hypothetical protein